ncbi:polysaccharide deacetylase family protein [Rhizobium puerariae]|uniref:Chitooligosaccharide deacetylase n=1 Tax=Rhizobium puerariae TaxID=1585791 RepID=A0ABV6AGM1_9HYPH
MPWKQNYTISDEIAIADADIVWPNGKQCCFGIVVDLSPVTSPAGLTEKSLAYPTYHFGMNEGLDSFLDMFARHGLRATFAIPAAIAGIYPSLIATISGAGHEIAANGLFGEDPLTLDEKTEAERVIQATELIESVTGTRPRGWYSLPRPTDPFATGNVSGRTIDLLIASGYAYFGNSLADDAPHYWVTDFENRKNLLALPYYYHFDDRFFLMFPSEGTGLERPDVLFRNWKTEFAAQYRRGRHFSMTVSPQRSGWGHRLDNLDAFLCEAVAMPGIWNATGSEIADHWTRQHPAATYLKLEPSIWKSYEGSLN